jgi:hypothetical protein
MRTIATQAISFLICCSLASGQAPQPLPQQQKKLAQRPTADNPELLSCTQILAMSSADYIAKTVAVNDSAQDGQQRGIRKYGACYDARTDALAASLARRGKKPTKAARSEFASFETALRNFTETALAGASPVSPDANGSFKPVQPGVPRALYASLYEKQFRYEFYEEYAAKATKTAKSVSSTSTPASGTPTVKSSARAGAGSPSASPASTKSPPHEATTEEQMRSDTDPMTQAKNRFGKILDALPDDRMHELHKAFGEVVEPYSISETTRLLVYRYAIFLLESPSSKPFAPPPF